MPHSVEFSRVAAEKLAAVERWYHQPGAGRAAARRVRAILAAIERLADFPHLGRAGENAGTREMTCRDHRIVYEVHEADEVVMVTNIFGPGEP